MNYNAVRTFLDSNNYLCLLEHTKQQLSDTFGHEFAMMQDYSQNNPHHCYNLLEHTVRTLVELDCSGLTMAESLELKLATLYHDVGKPYVAFDKNGKTVFYNHAKKSREIVERELHSVGVDDYEVQKVCFFVECHDMFISYKLKQEMKSHTSPYIKEITPFSVRKTIDKAIIEYKKKGEFVPSYYDFRLLLRLCRADALAQSKTIVENGKTIDTRERKLKRVLEIGRIVENL